MQSGRTERLTCSSDAASGWTVPELDGIVGHPAGVQRIVDVLNPLLLLHIGIRFQNHIMLLIHFLIKSFSLKETKIQRP